MSFPSIDLLVVAFAVAMTGAAGGLWLHSFPRGVRQLIPFSGGLLAGVALFGLLPELAEEIGWLRGVPIFGVGYLATMWLDRRFHGHAHGDAQAGGGGYSNEFTAPLVLAASAHAFLDGWGLASVGRPGRVGLVFGIAVMLHKAPEGLALGTIFRSATGSRAKALGLCLLAEAATFAGGWAGIELTPRLGTAWTNYPLAIAGGAFLYLGYHAVGRFWLAAGVGFAVAAAMQPGVWSAVVKF